MTDRDADRFSLAVDAVTAAFTLVARHATSSGTMEIIDINRRLRTLRDGDEELVRRTLHLLNALAESPRLFGFRLVIAALAQSLPSACTVLATSKDIRTAALDLRQVANEAESLHAPDVAVKLAGIIDALLKQNRATAQPTMSDGLH